MISDNLYALWLNIAGKEKCAYKIKQNIHNYTLKIIYTTSGGFCLVSSFKN